MIHGRGHSGPARRLFAMALGGAVLLGQASPAQAVPSAAGPRLDAGALFDAVAGAVSGTLSDLLPSSSQLVLDGTTHDISPSTPWTRFEGPVNAVAGNLAFGVIDLSIPSVGFPAAAGRTYNSASSAAGLLGHRWTWSYGITVTEGPDDVLVTWGDGRQDRHIETAPDTWDTPTGIHDTLIREGDGTLRLRTPDQTAYRFDTQGRLTSITDEAGNRLTIAWAAGAPSSITDTGGRDWTVAVDAQGRITRIEDSANRAVRYRYDASGDLVEVIDPLDQSTLYAYDGQHRLVSATDRRGKTTTFSWAGDRVSSVTGPTAAVTAFEYLDGRTRITDPEGHVRRAHFDEQARVTSLVDGRDEAEIWDWNGANERTRVTDRNGDLTRFSYDGRGNLLEAIDALDGHTAFTYDTQNHLLTRTDPRNRTTTWTYNAKGRPITETDPAGRVTTRSYDDQGQLRSVTDALGGRTLFTYDAYGNRLTVEDPLGNVTTSDHDAAGRVTSVTDPDGRTTATTYDKLGRVRSVTNGVGDTTTSTYDEEGNRLTVTDGRGNTTRFGYDARGLLTRVTDPLDNVTETAYDGDGRRIRVEDAEGGVTRFSYDAADRLTAVEDALGRVTSHGYDDVGNQVSVTDPRDHTTQYRYDALDRLVGVTDPMGGTASYGYDAVGNLTSVTDPNGRTTTTTFDVLDRPVTETDPLTNRQTAIYDALGRLLQSIDPRGAVSTYTYDDAGRMISASYPEGLVTYAYDGAGNRIRMSDEGGTTTWTYDGAGRLVRHSRATKAYDPANPDAAPGPNPPVPAVTTTTEYDYDAAGNLRRQTDPDGGTVTHTHDAAGNRTRATGSDGTVVQFSYDRTGRLTGRTDPNGVQGAWQFDAAGQVRSVVWTRGGGTVSSTEYRYDGAGNRTRITDARGVSDFTYDALDRLTGADYPDAPDVGYEYDAGGNRTSMTVGGNTIAYTYDAANRMLTAGAQTVEHDAAGNLTRRGTTTYRYDSQNRLIQVRDDGDPIMQNSFDGDDRRVTLEVNAEVISFAYDEHGKLPNVIKEVGAYYPTPFPDQVYAWGGGLLWARTNTDARHFFHQDALGSTVAITGEDGATLASPRYDAFGAPLDTLPTRLGSHWFAGEQLEPVTGLMHLRARTYDPETGRFLQVDPVRGDLADPQTLNPYAYARNNPLRYTDPSGEIFFVPLVFAIAAVGAFYLTTGAREVGDARDDLETTSQFHRRVATEAVKEAAIYVGTAALLGPVASRVAKPIARLIGGTTVGRPANLGSRAWFTGARAKYDLVKETTEEVLERAMRFGVGRIQDLLNDHMNVTRMRAVLGVSGEVSDDALAVAADLIVSGRAPMGGGAFVQVGYVPPQFDSAPIGRFTGPGTGGFKGVTVCLNTGYAEPCKTFGIDEYHDLSLLQDAPMALDIESLRATEPGSRFRVTLYRDTGLQGDFWIFDSDNPDIGGAKNQARSMKVERLGSNACTEGTDGIVLYRDTADQAQSQAAGGCLFITGSVPDLSDQGLPNGTLDAAISSIQFKGSFYRTQQVVLYRQPNYQDACGAYWQSFSDLRECADVAMSVEVKPFTPPPPVPIPPGTYFAGNIAEAAYLYPDHGAIRDGSLSTAWVGSSNYYETMLHFSWSDPATVDRVVVWDRDWPGGGGGIGQLAIAFSDGTIIRDIEMVVMGPHCVDITFPPKTIEWLQIIPQDAGGNEKGYREVEVWAPWGEQWSDLTCANPRQGVASPGIVSPPPYVAPRRPGRVPPPIAHLVVSLDPTRSTDGKAHGPASPYLIPVGANYETVLIEAGAYASAGEWNGHDGGKVRFTASGEVRINGTLTVKGKGYRGGPTFVGASEGRQGESWTGLGGQFIAANGGGGGGGNGADGGGAGGGHGSTGEQGASPPSWVPSAGGLDYGDPTIETLYLGSGGGSSGAQSENFAGPGGRGGGAIGITAGSFVLTGRLDASGNPGITGGTPANPRGGGGGSGGSIYIAADTIDLSAGTTVASGGAGAVGYRDGDPSKDATGGRGGDGRIRLEYTTSLVLGSITPAASAARAANSGHLVVSLDPTESSDGQAHTSDNPFLLRRGARYESVWVKDGAWASVSGWNGSRGGTLEITVSGTLRVDGTLDVDGKGYRGGPGVQGAAGGVQGESWLGMGVRSQAPNAGGGAGGEGADSGGAGGGYATPGANGRAPSDHVPPRGGGTYGDHVLASGLYLGSGGGSSGAQFSISGARGGNGGGAISIDASEIIVTGRISANGGHGQSYGHWLSPRGGGGGSGGSVLLRADVIDFSEGFLGAEGGLGGYGERDGNPSLSASGGNGGLGRIRVEYRQQLLPGASSPAASTAWISPQPIKDLVVSLDPARSSDRASHPASTPYQIPPGSTYRSVLVEAGAFASAAPWNGSTGGTVDFTAETVDIRGTLTVDGIGYRGGRPQGGANDGYQGESPLGFGAKLRYSNGGGGGGGGSADSGGGGGGYATAGGIGAHPLVTHQGEGGLAYGTPELVELDLGSGGGSSGSQTAGGAGGPGGGAVRIVARDVRVSGRLSADGAAGGSDGQGSNWRGGGGGSGGSILIRAQQIDLAGGVVRAKGGAGGYGIHDNDPNRMANGGTGGDGRVRIEPGSEILGATEPPASVQSASFLSVAGPLQPVIEGTDAVFVVTVANPMGQAVTVDYATEDGTAAVGADYTGASGGLTFPPEGPYEVELRVPVPSDGVGEPDETLAIVLANPSGAFLTPGGERAPATILNQLPPAPVEFGPSTPTPTVQSDSTFRLVFSEPVSGLTADDLGITGSSSDCVLTEPIPTTTPPTVEWSVAITGCSVGTVALDMAADSVVDTTGVTGPVAVASSTELVIDRTPPNVVSLALQAASDTGSSSEDRLTSAVSPVFDLVADEAIAGFAASDLSIVPGSTATGCVIGIPAGSGAVWTVALTGCTPGTVALRLAASSITDLAGNTAPAVAVDATTVTLDRIPPASLVLSAVTPARTTATDLVFRLSGDEDLGCATLDATDLAVTDGTPGAITDSGTACDIAVTSPVLDGTEGVTSLAASATFSVSDEAGNTQAAVTGTPTVTVDRIAPVVTLAALTADPAHGSALVFAVTAQAGEVLDCTTLTPDDLVITRGTLAEVTAVSATECDLSVTSSVPAGARTRCSSRGS